MKDRLVFVKTKFEVIPIITACKSCDLALLFPGTDNCEIRSCVPGFNYKFKKEAPEKIQTEYELIKQAFNILNRIGGSHTYNSRVELKAYIEDNKPTNFVTCTRENTKAGDIVRYKKSNEGEMCIVKYIYCGSVSRMIINSNSEEDSAHLSDFEIDLNNTEE